MTEHHDKSYRLLFSFPEMVEELIRYLVGGQWVERLDFRTLEKVSERSVGSSGVDGSPFRREKDLLWRLKYDSGTRWFYIYIHIEFQSQPERWMAVRNVIYKSLQFEELARGKEFTDSGKLPPVLSVVVYTGRSPWMAALSLMDLVEPMPDDAPGGFDLLSYQLIDGSRFPVDRIEDPNSLIAALLRLEQSRDLETLAKEAARLGHSLEDTEDVGLRRAFAVLINESLAPELPPVHDFMEVPPMLAERFQEWREDWKRAGLEEGRREGRREGLEQGLERGVLNGQRRLLAKQLIKRFGPLTPQVGDRLDSATSEELSAWGEQLLDAASITEVFDS